jgi:hypothetical protein
LYPATAIAERIRRVVCEAMIALNRLPTSRSRDARLIDYARDRRGAFRLSGMVAVLEPRLRQAQTDRLPRNSSA